MNFNKIILAGELTTEPELSYTKTKCAVVNFGLVVISKWKGRDGTEKGEICIVDCVAFAHTANAIKKYVNKGDTILVDGRLTFEAWTTREGEKRTCHGVAVNSVQFLPQDEEAKQKKAESERAAEQKKHEPLSAEDIPF